MATIIALVTNNSWLWILAITGLVVFGISIFVFREKVDKGLDAVVGLIEDTEWVKFFCFTWVRRQGNGGKAGGT